MKYKNILYLAFGLILLSGCVSTEVEDSGDVNQDKIYQSYYVEYDAEDNEAYGTACFRFGGFKGTTLQLTDGSEVELNGKKTRGEKEFLQGMMYRFENLSTKDTKFKFEFTTTDNKKYKNSIKLVPLRPMTPKDDIKNMTTTKIFWDGEPINSKESVVITITDQEGYTYSNMIDLKGANYVSITPDSLTPGLANLQLYRQFDKQLDEPTDAGGTIGGKYYSEVIPITISN